MTDSPGARPRPQYGEYATPEEQRARIQEPPTWMLEPVAPPAPGGPEAGDDPAKAPAPAAHPVAGAAVVAPKKRADRFVTLALLAIGLYTVLSSVFTATDFRAFSAQWMEIAGIEGTFTNIEQGTLMLQISVAVMAAVWVITAWLSFRLIARGKISWWIPLVGGVVANLISSVLIGIALFSDPAVMDYITSGGALMGG
ncbi:DUF6264 family protein [Agromyces atrinae]|uniref:Uncharacterized protein n=1 Tax=Agromyces atrinae TaxID=592376 RepID=A0A4Q2M1K9_9MICO|nr:DUF6264 family protein [Agromyces atrinae]NYD65484.1 hypothetical protein [Agromyces atrinae]RXZ85785.1 hypothetical protein ESP50_13380 [Agromyces atrinae]